MGLVCGNVPNTYLLNQRADHEASCSTGAERGFQQSRSPCRKQVAGLKEGLGWSRSWSTAGTSALWVVQTGEQLRGCWGSILAVFPKNRAGRL